MPVNGIEALEELTVSIGSDLEHDETMMIALVAVGPGTTIQGFVYQVVEAWGWRLPSRDWINAVMKKRPDLCHERGVGALLAETFRQGEGKPSCHTLIWMPGTVSEAPSGNLLQPDLKYLVVKG